MKINKQGLIIALVAVSAMTIISCNPARKWEKQERLMIEDYVSTLGDTAYVIKPSGLYYIEVTPGTGRQPVTGDTCSIKYKGKFTYGTIFDTNYNKTTLFKFVVGSRYAIDGIEEGVTYMKQGGVAKLITPSSLAYGPAGIYGILSGYMPLVWDIQLVTVKAGPTK
ncbi:MAG: FKBP-type peptidyl-prolyl cis-trans isomerase [Bacteroidales bacterium]